MVTGTVVGSGAWFAVTNITETVFTGTIRYGQPAYLTVAFSPTNLMTGTYFAAIQLFGTRPDGTTVAKTLPVSLEIGEASL